MNKVIFVYISEVTWKQVYPNIGFIAPTYPYIILEVTCNQVYPNITTDIVPKPYLYIRVLVQGLS